MKLQKKIIDIHQIGEVEITRNPRAKYLRIRLKEDNRVLVTIPNRETFANAQKFVLSKKSWILKNQAKISERAKKRIQFLPGIPFTTRKHSLVFKEHFEGSYAVKNGLISIYYPAGSNLEEQEWQEFIRQAIIEAYRIEAKEYIIPRTKELAQIHGLKHGKISVRNAKTRWGSCSGVNNISLNIQLMRLPSELIDYVILHELAHTVHKNHSSQFWSFLNQISGDAQGLDHKLRAYSTKF